MKVLTDLGFSRYRSVDPELSILFWARCGYLLPNSYLEFLCFREAPQMLLEFRFVRADGEEWVGCISEFCNIAPRGDSLDTLDQQIIRSANYPNRAFLPVASDPGGNWLYLELSKVESRVVDVDYATGLVSEVAANFETFLTILKVSDEMSAYSSFMPGQ